MNLPNPDHFTYRECNIAGDPSWLINPKKSDDDIWAPDNLGFRSLIVRQSDNRVISRGQNKFFNVYQSSHLYPNPENYSDVTFHTKLDGSLVIVSKFQDTKIIRTRGSLDVEIHESGAETRDLVNSVQKLWEHPLLETHSFLFENTTPSCKIVLLYEKPEITLLDIIDNQTGIYLSQEKVDEIAAELSLARPKQFNFSSIKDVLENCKTLKDLEGYVINYAGGQHKLKAKGDFYLKLHRAKSLVGSVSALFDLWVEYGLPDYFRFYELVGKNLEYELAEMSKNDMKTICRVHQETLEYIDAAKQWLELVKLNVPGQNRGVIARMIMERDRENSSIYFAALDNKLDNSQIVSKMVRKKLKL